MSCKEYFSRLLSVLAFLCLMPFAEEINAAELIGSLEGEVQVDQGQLTWSLPIELPSGVNGITPNINIAYSPLKDNGILGL